MRISDGSSDVCSSDLLLCLGEITNFAAIRRLVGAPRADQLIDDLVARVSIRIDEAHAVPVGRTLMEVTVDVCGPAAADAVLADLAAAVAVPVVVDGEPSWADLLWGAALGPEIGRASWWEEGGPSVSFSVVD